MNRFLVLFKSRLFVFILATIGFSQNLSAHSFSKPQEALHLRDQPSDFTALGLSIQVEPWEDGRRTPLTNQSASNYFEWWYFDAVLEDKTVIVVWFGDNWGYGNHKRVVNIEITRPGQKTIEFSKGYDLPGEFANDHAHVKISNHLFSGDLNRYVIRVDPAETGGMGCDLVLDRLIPSYRPGTGHVASGEKFFAWLVGVPNGSVSGTLTLNGVSQTVKGTGYHDHNWGNISPAELFENWWWGRGVAGELTSIVARLKGKKSVGGTEIPILFTGKVGEILVNAYAEDVTFKEASKVKHADPHHSRKIASSVLFSTKEGAHSRFTISDSTIASVNFLEGQPWWVRFGAKVLKKKPWYSRFKSYISLTAPGASPQEGEGTLELYEMQ